MLVSLVGLMSSVFLYERFVASKTIYGVTNYRLL